MKKKKRINIEKSFKSKKCVICSTNKPNILFCNCGHIPTCDKCEKVNSLKDCPICKSKNYIKRMID